MILLKKRFYQMLTPGLVIFMTIAISGLFAGFSTLRSSRHVVESYVSVWEEEIARNLLLKGDVGLFEKIRAQIKDLATDVEATGNEALLKNATGSCFAAQTINVTLYGTPAGELQICRSSRKLITNSLTSPIFAFGMLVGILFAMWLVRRNSREESARALSELAVRVAHDIRSPLTALKIAVAQLKGAEVEGLIESATARISRIAEELLQQNRPPKEMKKSPAPLKTVHESIRDLVSEKKSFAPSNVIFEISRPATTSNLAPPSSSPEFERIVANLLQNAVEATSAADNGDKIPRIAIDTVESDAEISVTIRDNGIGIPKHVLSRVGEVGFTYGKSSGNGIGFSSARQWARGRGGDLGIRSLEGTGTEVRLTIPRR